MADTVISFLSDLQSRRSFQYRCFEPLAYLPNSTKFDMVVNPAAAKSLGLVIPPSVLNRADEVIE
jgi:hypothetical protein